MSIGGAFVTLNKVVDAVTIGAKGLYDAFNLLKRHPIIMLLTLGTIAVGAWIANFDAIKQGFHDLVDDMSAYFNNSTVGKLYNATIKPAGEFVDKITGAIGDTLGVWGQKLFGKNTDPTASGTEYNEYLKELDFENKLRKMRGQPPKPIPTFDEFANVQVPAPKVVEGTPTARMVDNLAQALTANLARMGVAVQDFTAVPLAPVGAAAGGAKGNVTVGSHNNTTVNNYVEVKVEGTNATAEDIGQATAQATTQATVDTSDKGTFQ